MKTKKKAPIIRIKGFDGDWEQRKFPEFVSFFNGLTYTPDDVQDTGTLVLRSSNVKNGEIVDADNVYVSDKVAISENVQKGDIVVVVRNGSRALIGKHAQIKAFMPNTVIGAFMTGLRSEQSSFVNALLDTSAFEKEIAKNMGATINQITGYMFSKMEFMIPSEKEQQKIGDYFTNLDQLITLHQREIDRIVCLRKAMVEKMFPQNGADVPAVRFSRYKEPWRLCQFSEIFTERHIIDTISDEYPQLAFTIEEGVIRPEDKKTNKRDFLIIDKATKKYLQTEYDDIIYNPANVIYGAIHRNALGKGCVSPIYKIFYTDQDSTFMECIVRHPNFIKEISRSMEGTVKKLRTLKPKAFLEMNAYIAPTIEEQRQIGEYFRQMDRLIEIEKEELEKIKHIKSACLEKMFV